MKILIWMSCQQCLTPAVGKSRWIKHLLGDWGIPTLSVEDMVLHRVKRWLNFWVRGQTSYPEAWYEGRRTDSVGR